MIFRKMTIYAATVIVANMYCQKRSSEASLTAKPRKHVIAPTRIAEGMACWSNSTNRNILSSCGRIPNLSANSTIPMPRGGNTTRRVKEIPSVVLKPNSELPGGPTENVPPSTSITQGTNAAPSMVRLSVTTLSNASSPKKSSLVLGIIPTAMAKREAIIGGWIKSLNGVLSATARILRMARGSTRHRTLDFGLSLPPSLPAQIMHYNTSTFSEICNCKMIDWLPWHTLSQSSSIWWSYLYLESLGVWLMSNIWRRKKERQLQCCYGCEIWCCFIFELWYFYMKSWKGALRIFKGPWRLLPPFGGEHLELAQNNQRAPISPKGKPPRVLHGWLENSGSPWMSKVKSQVTICMYL